MAPISAQSGGEGGGPGESVTRDVDVSAAARLIGTRAVRGAGALLMRQVVVKGTTIVGTIVLARILSPADFGVYAVVLFGITLLTLMGDGGLAASLIQSPEEPGPGDFRVLFAFQEMVYVPLAISGILLAPGIAAALHLGAGAIGLIRLMSVSFVIASFRTMATSRLERHLQFDKLAIVEVVEVLVFQGGAILLAVSGLGVYSLGLALVASQIASAALVNVLSPWPIGLRWDRRILARHLSFGVNYQGFVIVDALKNGAVPLGVGLIAGATAVGYIVWATGVANYALIFMTILGRLYFPAFSRLQADRPALYRAFERALRVNCLVVYGPSVALLLYAREITETVFTSKWMPATDLFPYFVAISLLLAIVVPCISLLNAIGRPRVVFLFGVGWLLLAWILTVPLVTGMGFVGFGVANLLMNALDVILFIVVSRLTGLNLARVVAPYLAAALVSGGSMFVLREAIAAAETPGLAFPAMALGILVYLGILSVIERDQMRWVIRATSRGLYGRRRPPADPGSTSL